MRGDHERAIVSLEKAIEVDPAYGPAQAHLGMVYYTRRYYEKAIEYLEQAIANGATSEEYYYTLGLSYVYLDRCAEARPWLEKALELNPNSSPAHEGIRRCGDQ